MADINKEASWVTARLMEVSNATQDGTNILITNANIQNFTPSDVVRTSAQELTDAEQAQVRTNIGAASQSDIAGVQSDIAALSNDKMDKLPEGSVAGNIPLIDNNENIADSGVSKDNLLIAPQLASNNVKTESIPYIYRQTGGGIGVGNREYDSIVGGSVVNNQAVKALSNDDWANESGVTVSYGSSNDATISSTKRSNGIHTRYLNTTVVNHIYYLVAYLYSTNTYNNICFGYASSTSTFANNWSTVANTWKLNNALRRASSAMSSPIYIYSTNTGGYQDVKIKDPMIIDLTEMFGSTVAEYIFTNSRYDILRNQRFRLSTYRPYTASPSLESVSGLSSHQMKDGNGNVIAEYPLDSSLTLRGVAILDDNNNIKFDGDTYAPDGTVTRRYAVLTIDGTESLWYKSGTRDGSFYLGMSGRNYKGKGNVICAKLITVHSLSNYAIGCIYPDTMDISFWFAEGVGKTLDQFKAWLSSNPFTIIYEVNAPTIETATPYDALQICDPLGTEEYVTTGICPVGHVTQYPENQVAKLDGLPSDFSTLIAPTEKEFKASDARTTGFKFIYQNQLYKCIANVASGAAYTIGTNVKKTTLVEELDLLS